MGDENSIAVRSTLGVFVGFLAVSAVFSWPAACLDPAVLVTRHADLYPTIWLLSSAPLLDNHATAWPLGESLVRVDSWVLLAIAKVCSRWVSGGTLAMAVAWVGPALGATAAEWCATRAFRVARPWSLIAGFSWGFSGIAATALLEGHVHHLLNPWLPLAYGFAVRAGRPAGRWWDAGFAGLAWSLALFTTAYAGVIGAVLMLSTGIARRPWRMLAASLPALPAGIAYAWIFSQGGVWSDASHHLVELGTNSLGGLAGWSEAIDTGAHSIGAPLGWTVFWLFLAAPVVLRGEADWRVPFAVGAFGLVLSLGPAMELVPGGASIPSPLAFLQGFDGVAWFRFPVRFLWLYAMCGGLVAARVAARLAAPRLLVLFCAVDVLAAAGMPFRLHRQIGTSPSAYDAAPPGAAILDLFAATLDRSAGEVELWQRALGCFYQGQHGRPIMEVCIGTGVDSPREITDRWLTAQLLASPPSGEPIARRLANLGIGAVAFHRDFYRAADALAIESGLTTALGPLAADTYDGGEHVQLWSVPAVADSDLATAWSWLKIQER